MSDATKINLGHYIAGKSAPIQKWLWLGEAREPCEHVQLSLPMYSFPLSSPSPHWLPRSSPVSNALPSRSSIKLPTMAGFYASRQIVE